jgi:hypothetical protein
MTNKQTDKHTRFRNQNYEMKERRQLCNKHHLKLRLKKRKSHQLCLPNASKDRFVILNVNFSVIDCASVSISRSEIAFLTACINCSFDPLQRAPPKRKTAKKSQLCLPNHQSIPLPDFPLQRLT